MDKLHQSLQNIESRLGAIESQFKTQRKTNNLADIIRKEWDERFQTSIHQFNAKKLHSHHCYMIGGHEYVLSPEADIMTYARLRTERIQKIELENQAILEVVRLAQFNSSTTPLSPRTRSMSF